MEPKSLTQPCDDRGMSERCRAGRPETVSNFQRRCACDYALAWHFTREHLRRTPLWTIHRSGLPTGRMPRQYVLGAGPVEAPVAESPARLCPAPLTAAASSLRTPPIAASRVVSMPCVGVDLRSAFHVHSDVRRATRVNVPLARQQRKSPGSEAGARPSRARSPPTCRSSSRRSRRW